MWRWYDAAELPLRRRRSRRSSAKSSSGRNPKDAKVLLAKEITTRFHSAAAADAARAGLRNSRKGGVPDEIPASALAGAPLGIGQLLKQARPGAVDQRGAAPGRQGGVRIDGAVVSDKALKLAAGTYVVQVGKRKFARVTLS